MPGFSFHVGKLHYFSAQRLIIPAKELIGQRCLPGLAAPQSLKLKKSMAGVSYVTLGFITSSYFYRR